jgi:hypothetical protein
LLLNLNVPRINDYMTSARIETVHAQEGQRLAPGAKLFDMTVDLSLAAPHDCPPISHYRIVLRETAYMRRLDIERGDEPAVGAQLALFSTDPDEPLQAAPARMARMAIATIMFQSIWSVG